jgi:hypothetical protein
MRRGQFRTHLEKQRCVIPAEGFYEWREESGKQPYYFSRKDGKPLMLAGIWEESEYKGDRRIDFAILTEEPNELVPASRPDAARACRREGRRLHHRDGTLKKSLNPLRLLSASRAGALCAVIAQTVERTSGAGQGVRTRSAH